ASIAASHKAGKSRKSGDTGGSTGDDGGAAPRAVVMIVSVCVAVALRGVTMTVAGLNDAMVCAGKPATMNETEFVNPSGTLVGVTVMVIMACFPAMTVVLAGPLTVKPSTVKLMEFAEVPPPGMA